MQTSYEIHGRVMQTGVEYSALAKTCCIRCEMHVLASAEYSALAKTCDFLSETSKLLLKDMNIWQKFYQILSNSGLISVSYKLFLQEEVKNKMKDL